MDRSSTSPHAGLGLLLALIPLAGLGYVTTSYLVGRSLRKAPANRIVAFLLGWGALRVVALVPVVGVLVWVAAIVVGLGVLLVALWGNRSRESLPATVPPGSVGARTQGRESAPYPGISPPERRGSTDERRLTRP